MIMEKGIRKLIIGTSIGIFSAWLFGTLCVRFIFFEDWSKSGPMGDTFGAVNSLFTGFAFAGLIVTIVLQQKGLEVQQKDMRIQQQSIELQTKAIEMQTEELRIQQEETARMADQLESQKNLMTLQRVESIVFQLLKNLNDLVDTLKLKEPNGTGLPSGRSGICEMQLKIHSDKPRFTFEQFYQKNKTDLDRYFKMIVYILHFIQKSDINDKMKSDLASALNIQLSDDEIIIIYMHFNRSGSESFLELLKKFNLYSRYERITSSKQTIT